MSAGAVLHPWRRFLRISVRGLVVLVLVIGAGLGWLVRSARIQRDAVAAIQNAGGSVEYDWEWSDGKSNVGCKTWAPRWLVDLIGVDYFGHVAFVFFWLEGPEPPIAVVGQLTEVQRLEFRGWSSLSDAGLAHLRSLTKLSELGLAGTQVTDAGLIHLDGFTKLSVLNLFGTKVTDAGLRHLPALAKLSELGLASTRVTDLGLVDLTDLTNLTVLDLRDTQITDGGLAHLRGFANLSSLALEGTQVTDAGVKMLEQALPNLAISR